MKNCIVKYKDANGNLQTLEVEDSRALDEWLISNQAKINEQLKLGNKSLDAIFDISPLDSADAKLQKYFEDSKKISERVKGNNNLSPSSAPYIAFGDNNGRSPVVNAFDNSNALNIYKTVFKSEGKTDAEAERLAKQLTKDTDEFIKTRGTWIHQIISDVLNGEKAIRTDSTNPELYTVSEELKKKALDVADKIKKAIERKFSGNKGYKVYSEKTISLEKDHFTNDFLALLQEALPGKDIKGMSGICDLIVVDDLGHIHLFDFKVMSALDADHISNKTKPAAVQLSLYAEMLKNAGFIVDEVAMIPIKMSIVTEGSDFKRTYNANGKKNKFSFEIEDIDFDNSKITPINRNNAYAERIARLFGYTPNFSNKELTEANDFMKEAYYQLTDNAKDLTNLDDDVRKQVEKAWDKNSRGIKVFSISSLKETHEDLYNKAINAGAKYFVWRQEKYMGKGDMAILFKTKNEVDEFLAGVFKEIRTKHATMCSRLAEDLRGLIKNSITLSEKLNNLDNILTDFSFGNNRHLFDVFSKYAVSGWELVSNETLEVNGIFIFAKNGRCEIICLTPNDIFKKIPLNNGGQTVLQNIIHDEEVGTDNTKTLNTLYGNYLAIKVAMILSNYSDIIPPGSQVEALKVVNIYQKQTIDEPLGILEETWNKLAFYWNDKNRTIKINGTALRDRKDLKLLSSKENGQLMDPTKAYVYRAFDIIDSIEECDLCTIKRQFIANLNGDNAIKSINELIRLLKKDYKQKHREEIVASKLNYSNKYHLAYGLLHKALLTAANWYTQTELDMGTIFNNKLELNGLYASSPQRSMSSAMRILTSTMSTFKAKIRDEYNNAISKWGSQLQKALEERGYTKGHSSDLSDFFKNWYEEDNQLVIKDPFSDPYFEGRKEEKKLAKMLILDFITYRGLDPTDVLNNQGALDIEYRKIPLVEVGLFQQIKNGGEIMTALKQKAGDAFDTVYNLFNDKDISNKEKHDRENIDEDYIPNYYFSQDQDIREEKLQKYGESKFDHDLDSIYLFATLANITETISREFMPFFTAIRTVLSMSRELDGISGQKIQDAVEDYIRSAVFEKSIVQSNHINIMKFMNMMKSITSYTTLAFNVKNLARENIADAFRTSMALYAAQFDNNKDVASSDPTYDSNSLFMSKITSGTYLSCLENVIVKSMTDKKMMRKISQLNLIAGMTGVSKQQLGDAAKKSESFGLGLDDGYFTTTWPDFFHRNAILDAYLQSIEAWDAYELDENDILHYDMFKDKRFNLIAKYGFTDDLSAIKKGDRKQYLLQLNVYQQSLKRWQRSNQDMKFGDKLPQALTIDEMTSIRNWADTLYGSYDPDTKTLMQNQVLGSLFFQYKNYTLAMLNGWWSAPGHVANERLVCMKNTEGKKILKKISTPEEFKQTGKVMQFVTEDEVTDEDLASGRYEYYLVYEQDPFEGKINTYAKIAKSIVTGDKDYWEFIKTSPIAKYNTLLLLYDSLIMMILTGLLAMIYGKEKTSNMSDQEWWIRWSYGVANGVAQDGPFYQTLNSVVGDGSMPMITTLQRYVKNAYSVITGKKNAAYAILNSFGATRELTSLFNNLAED